MNDSPFLKTFSSFLKHIFGVVAEDLDLIHAKKEEIELKCWNLLLLGDQMVLKRPKRLHNFYFCLVLNKMN